jgi:ABC-type uncharacterized transport system permease subunit
MIRIFIETAVGVIALTSIMLVIAALTIYDPNNYVIGGIFVFLLGKTFGGFIIKAIKRKDNDQDEN